MLIHTTPTDMLSDSLTLTCLQAAVRRRLQWTLDHPSSEGSVHGGSEFEGSARSSQWSDDDDTYTCNGDSCEFQGTLAEVIEHENQCEQMIEKLGLPTEAEMETEAETGPETEMSQAETDTE